MSYNPAENAVLLCTVRASAIALLFFYHRHGTVSTVLLEPVLTVYWVRVAANNVHVGGT